MYCSGSDFRQCTVDGTTNGPDLLDFNTALTLCENNPLCYEVYDNACDGIDRYCLCLQGTTLRASGSSCLYQFRPRTTTGIEIFISKFATVKSN